MSEYKFEKYFSDKLIDNLKSNELFKLLVCDIKSKKIKIFPAIRKNEMHFYYKGRRLVKFTKDGFIANAKYLGVENKKGDMNIETAIKNYNNNYSDLYKSLKRNAEVYSEDESKNVSNLYRFSYFLNNDEIVLLDIEMSIKSLQAGKKSDRFDVILYNRTTKTIQVIETKTLKNKEIKLHGNKKCPDVVNQICRYNQNIKERKDEILQAYSKCIDLMKKTFGSHIKIDLDKPEKINESVTLLIFDYKNNDREKLNKITDIINKCLREKNIKSKVCNKGDMKTKINQRTLETWFLK